MIKKMPRKKDRAHFKRDALKGKPGMILGKGLRRGGTYIS